MNVNLLVLLSIYIYWQVKLQGTPRRAKIAPAAAISSEQSQKMSKNQRLRNIFPVKTCTSVYGAGTAGFVLSRVWYTSLGSVVVIQKAPISENKNAVAGGLRKLTAGSYPSAHHCIARE